MNKSTIFIGIDISKDVFDVYSPDQGHSQFPNNVKGFKRFLKVLDNKYWCVMEATGCYHHQLAMFLFDEGIRVTVMNPLVIKRFIQMKLNQVKTDKSDKDDLSLWSRTKDAVMATISRVCGRV